MKTPFQELAFGKIKKNICQYCSSSLGEKLTLDIKPLSSVSEIENRNKSIGDTMNFLEQGNNFDLSGLTDTEKYLNRLKQNDPFSVSELLFFFQNIRIENRLQKNYKSKIKQFTKLSKLIAKIQPHFEIENKFIRTFNKKNEIKDSASKELASIRKEIKVQKKRITDRLEKILENRQYRRIVFDSIITKRDNRYVIPIKSGAGSTLKGVVHGSSHSGASVYIEPLTVVEVNNKIIELYDREKKEIYRILFDLFSDLRENKSALSANLSILQQVDFLKASAQYFIDINGKIPIIKKEPVLSFTKARHPILYSTLKKEKDIIPFSLELGKDYPALIISGVNTGGKTVTLKAIGLLTVMALSGLLVTAKKAEIGLFSSFFTDISDEQSLEDSISTFSSHVKKINNILRNADERSLILIDELGTGTNPEEGSAFAQAVIETLLNSNSKIVITTHLNKLKIFATENDQCENSSMRFDEKTLKPTYILDIGIPGNSYALDIAKEYKISDNILSRAREILDDKSLQLGYLLKKAEKQRNLLEQKILEYDKKHEQLDKKLLSISKKEKDWDKVEKKRKNVMLDKAEEDLAHLYLDLENELKRIKSKAKKSSKIKKKSLGDLQAKINEQKKKIEQKKDEISDLKLVRVKKPETGKKVFHKSLDIVGKIKNISKNSITIMSDGLIFSCNLKDIYEVPTQKRKNSDTKDTLVTVNDTTTNEMPSELNIMGLTFDEAQPEVDKYIDQAIMLDYSRIRVLHGKGTGRLRKKVRFHLKSDQRIKDFYAAPRAEGGNGVTILEL